jgi:hypothetical protein
MATPALSRAVWRKSSYSNANGECVEAAVLDGAAWRKSTRSNNGGECVEAATLSSTAWHKSRHSNNGGACVEIAGAGPAVAVRDSKNPSGPHLDFPAPEWQRFVTTLQTTP